MGEDIQSRRFSADDFEEFQRRLDNETSVLGRRFEHGSFSRRGPVAGFELEAWLVDDEGRPVPRNEEYLDALGTSLVVPELATFNVEINGSPTALTGRAFTRLHEELATTWARCRRCALELGCDLLIIGILPTVTEPQLSRRFMSDRERYKALNERLLATRQGRPFEIDIRGDEQLHLVHGDVMLEAGATSFQIHLQVSSEQARDIYNASLAASAPMVAVSANSPFLFGRALWDETRIPLFEQAIAVGADQNPRVTFGRGYVQQSLRELFEENLRRFQVLLPELMDDDPRQLSHLRFHNGTIWRWNRPLVGFDYDGQPHLRVEHRVVPAGPSLRDCIANAAFYYGLVRALAAGPDVTTRLPFSAARANFYAAARSGLASRVHWFDGDQDMRTLLLDRLLPLARRGYTGLDIPIAELDEYLGIVEARVRSGQNGAEWQRRWVRAHGKDMAALVRAYRDRQREDTPVHTWSV